MRKRTISFDDHDEALIAEIGEKYRPFATAHTIVRLAARQGLRMLREGLQEWPEATDAPSVRSTEGGQ